MRLGPSREPWGEGKGFTYHCFKSLWLIINLLSQKKGEHHINLIKVNGIMIPFSESLKSCFIVVLATEGLFFLVSHHHDLYLCWIIQVYD